MKLFVREEGRHARVLGWMVRALGAGLLGRHWTASGFTWLRRLIGVRTKLLVALAAEVVGGTFYALLAQALGEGELSTALRQISADEDAHLSFQTEFFASRLQGVLARELWCALWCVCGAAASLIVLWDHRQTFRAFGIPRGAAWRLLWSRVKQVVKGVRAPGYRRQPIPGRA